MAQTQIGWPMSALVGLGKGLKKLEFSSFFGGETYFQVFETIPLASWSHEVAL